MQRSRNTPTSITLEESMNQSNGKKQRKRFSAEEKWQIYRECEQAGAKVGEILRKYGLYSSDLQNIRKMVKEGSLERLRQSRPGKKRVTTVPVGDYERYEAELTRGQEIDEKVDATMESKSVMLEQKALAEMTVMFTALKKKVNLE